MVGYGENGSVVGPQNLATNSVASGLWSLGEVAENLRGTRSWPGGPDITGGDLRVEDFEAGYIYEVFYSSRTVTITDAITADILVVGGGGSASRGDNVGAVNSRQGGAGAGGVMTVTGASLAAQSSSVIIGAGAATATVNGFIGLDGGDTTVPLLTTYGQTVLYGCAGGGGGGRGGNAGVTSGRNGRTAPQTHSGTTYANAVGSGGAGGGGGVQDYSSGGNGGLGGATRSQGVLTSAGTTQTFGSSTINGAQAYWYSTQGATGGSGTTAGTGNGVWQAASGLVWNNFDNSSSNVAPTRYYYSCGGMSAYSGLLASAPYAPSGSYINNPSNGSGNAADYTMAVTGRNSTCGTVIFRFAG